jgi:hypothetical protein
VETTVSFPGPRATDPRITVTLREPGTPWPIRLHFLDLRDTDDEAWSARVNVGFELGENYDGILEYETAPEPLDPMTVARIASRYTSYLRIAEEVIALDRGGAVEAVRQLRGPGVKPARLSDDFYRLIGADYEQRRASGVSAPLQELADAHHVDKSTASRWVKTAKQRGYVREGDRG